jgi:hypothetical protein
VKISHMDILAYILVDVHTDILVYISANIRVDIVVASSRQILYVVCRGFCRNCL